MRILPLQFSIYEVFEEYEEEKKKNSNWKLFINFFLF